MRKESITRTKEQEQAIVDYIIECGFNNVAEFSKAVEMDRQNVWARIKGRTNPDIRMLFKWAKVLYCDIDKLLQLFYPNEWEEYSK